MHLLNKNYIELSDEAVITLVKEGNKELYEILIKRYNRMLYRVALSFGIQDADCDDLIQETYIKSYLKLEQFKGESKYRSWLTRILINECLMHKRSAKRQTGRLMQISNLFSDKLNPQSGYTMHDRSEIGEKLNGAVEQLPEKYKTVFILREVEGFDIKETAALLNISELNVKVRLHRSKKLLQKKLLEQFSYADLFQFGNTRCDLLTQKVLFKILQ